MGCKGTVPSGQPAGATRNRDAFQSGNEATPSAAVDVLGGKQACRDTRAGLLLGTKGRHLGDAAVAFASRPQQQSATVLVVGGVAAASAREDTELAGHHPGRTAGRVSEPVLV